MARATAHAGLTDLALQVLSHVSSGFFCVRAFKHDPWLDPLRSRPEFDEILQRVMAGQRQAAEVFVAGGGPALVGLRDLDVETA
jgi:hypothetical protein